MQETRAQGPLGDVPRAIGEEKHKERRWQSEPEPRGHSAQIASPKQADSEPGLARGGAGQKLRQRDQIDIGALAQPAAALDKLGAEVTEMRDRAAKGRHPQLKKDEKNFPRRTSRRSRFRSCRLWLGRSPQDHPSRCNKLNEGYLKSVMLSPRPTDGRMRSGLGQKPIWAAGFDLPRPFDRDRMPRSVQLRARFRVIVSMCLDTGRVKA